MRKLILVILVVPLLLSFNAAAQTKSKREQKQWEDYQKRQKKKLEHDILSHDIKQYRRKLKREKNIKTEHLVSAKKRETKADKKARRRSNRAIARVRRGNEKAKKQSFAAIGGNKEFTFMSSKRRKKSHNYAFTRSKKATGYARRHDYMSVVVK